MSDREEEYANRLACFRSEQMSTADLLAFMNEDDAFAAYVLARISEEPQP